VEREVVLDARCPACASPALVMRSQVERLPYFGETLFTTVLCQRCDFRHGSQMQLEVRPPARHTLRFALPRDAGVRVVRSHSGTWRIPELGFLAEPAEASEAFVSNLEGLLERVRDILVRARTMFDAPGEQAAVEARLLHLQRIMDGAEQGTLVVEDPNGTSAILGEGVVVEALTQEEAGQLRTGVVLLDAADLRPSEGA
jgi:zinc finger protein